MVGSSNCILALLALHAWTKLCSASSVCPWFFPYTLLARRNARLVVEHVDENHGAMCLSHLFGLVKSRCVDDTSTTSAFMACSSRNYSTLSALTSLDTLSSSTMAIKATANSSVDVNSLHLLALMQYVARQSPVFHRYFFDV